jgi:glycopeptide antibiotics resistance protein
VTGSDLVNLVLELLQAYLRIRFEKINDSFFNIQSGFVSALK